MCLGTPKTPDVKPPPQYAAQRAPSMAIAKQAGGLARDKAKALNPALLTGSFGVGPADTTGKKVLLGQ